jgi:deoxyadenosine/deoxycytidine kinase
MKRGKIIILEACPGAGKTTLGKSLQYHQPSCVFIPEEVDNVKLSEYLKDMKSKAADFQFSVQMETINRLKKAILLAKEGKTVVLERGLIGNSCFAELQYESGLISETKIIEYRRKFTYSQIPEIDEVDVQIIYMRASSKFCLERIARRARKGEDSYSLDYIEKLKAKHDLMLGDYTIIDCEKDVQFMSSGHLPFHFVEALIVI